MQCLPTFKPLLHSFDFTQLDDGVKVTRHEGIHLGVKGGEEPPDHGEHVDGIDKEVMGQLINWTQVETIGGTRQVAEVDHQWVIRADVVVQSDTPAAVVEGGDCLKVFYDPFKVTSFLMCLRLRIPIEGKSNYTLPISTLPRVSRAGGKFIRLWDSEEMILRIEKSKPIKNCYLVKVSGIVLGHRHCSSSNLKVLLGLASHVLRTD